MIEAWVVLSAAVGKRIFVWSKPGRPLLNVRKLLQLSQRHPAADPRMRLRCPTPLVAARLSRAPPSGNRIYDRTGRCGVVADNSISRPIVRRRAGACGIRICASTRSCSSDRGSCCRAIRAPLSSLADRSNIPRDGGPLSQPGLGLVHRNGYHLRWRPMKRKRHHGAYQSRANGESR